LSKTLYSSCSNEKGNQDTDKQLKKKYPGKCWIPKGVYHQRGKSSEPLTCNEHTDKTGHRQGINCISGYKGQNNGQRRRNDR